MSIYGLRGIKMTDKESIPLPTTVPAETSSPVTPNPKRAKMSSPDRPAQKTEADMASKKPESAKTETVEKTEVEKSAPETQPQTASGSAVDAPNTESADIPHDRPLVEDDDELEAVSLLQP